MEKECSQCHRLFHAVQEKTELCPDCLRKQFSVARALPDAERVALQTARRAAEKRQEQRARRMQENYAAGSVFGFAGKLRFAEGVVLYLGVLLFFVLTSGDEVDDRLGFMDGFGRHVLSLLFGGVAALLVASASARFRHYLLPLGVLMVGCAWFLPDLASVTSLNGSEAPAPKAAAAERQGAEARTTHSGRLMTDADLEVFRKLDGSSEQHTHYAIYMTPQDARTRDLMREALSRLLGAEFTRAYTRGEGALYVVTNVPGKRRNISGMLTRFGRLAYEAPSEGIYELRFDADKTNMVSKFHADALMMSAHSSFVAANLAELSCLDPMRIRSAAKRLTQARVQTLRREIRNALLQVLADPWEGDWDTYSALAEALATYALQDDSSSRSVCLSFFLRSLEKKRPLPSAVVNYMVREVPEKVLDPIVEQWCADPMAWGESMNQLGKAVQPKLLARLQQADSLRQVNSIIRFLRDHGDAQAIPAIQPFTRNSDSLISHAAQEAVKTLEQRR
ncbi:MAG: hypothetical protein ACI4O9_07605 [Akkermansia sp.]